MSLSEEVMAGRTDVKKKTPVTLPGIRIFERVSAFLSKALAWISGCCLLMIVFLVVLNGISRVVYVPFFGTTEIVGWLGAISTAFALGYTQLNQGHVDIDILTQKFPFSIRRPLSILVLSASTIFFILVAWQVIVFGFCVAAAGNVSETLGLPFYPMIFLMAFGLVGFSVVLLAELLTSIWRRGDQ